MMMPPAPDLFSAQEAEDVDSILDLCRVAVYSVNVGNGWFDKDRRFLEDMALLASEASEGVEEFREHRPGRFYTIEYETLIGGEVYTRKVHVPLSDGEAYPPEHKPSGVPSELADIFVRLLDTCHRYKVDLGAEFRAKLAYNTRRGYKHGDKAV